MSKLYELLQGVIQKVNKSVSTEEQKLTDEQKLQVKTNLGINDSTGVNADWNQNDVNAPDYVKNRTHYRKPTMGSPLLTVDMSTVENGIESYEEDGETKYRWTNNSYRVSVTSHDGLEDYVWLSSDFFGYDEICEVSSGDAGTSLSNSRFSLERREVSLGDGDFGWAWIFTPKREPTKSMLDWLADERDGGHFNFVLYSIEYSYEKLDPEYLPVSNTVSSYNSTMIPNCGAVVDAIDVAKKDVDYFDIKNSPCYDIPEKHEAVILPDNDGYIDGSLSSPIAVTDSQKQGICEGVQYKVRFRGEDYICEGIRNDDVTWCTVYWLGNAKLWRDSLEESDYPFFILQRDGETFLYFEGDHYSDDGTWAEFYVDKIVPAKFQKLDEKFLPDSIITISDDEMTQLENLLNPTNTEE